MPHTPLPPKNRSRAKSMRRAMTDAELKLWNEIRAHRLMGLGFRRQFPIGGFIVDFACPDKRLIVELDGSQHAEDAGARYDAQRSETFRRGGWTVLRFWNDDVLREIDDVCQHIVITAGLTTDHHARTATTRQEPRP
ncbi:endonuclease domain-containing protein [Mesorhizobium sp. CAU 1741]|uniref:endonuclease domain-containing protein n=1 Tax=Mesorhizobium sp. CAU 1741 TaxID=3140366 RepID=UPI00325A7C2F